LTGAGFEGKWRGVDRKRLHTHHRFGGENIVKQLIPDRLLQF